jgi:hypothetical protein
MRRRLCSGPDLKPEISARGPVSAPALRFLARHKVVNFPLDLLSLFPSSGLPLGPNQPDRVVFVGGLT